MVCSSRGSTDSSSSSFFGGMLKKRFLFRRLQLESEKIGRLLNQSKKNTESTDTGQGLIFFTRLEFSKHEDTLSLKELMEQPICLVLIDTSLPQLEVKSSMLFVRVAVSGNALSFSGLTSS